jgi:hypothetical protein
MTDVDYFTQTIPFNDEMGDRLVYSNPINFVYNLIQEQQRSTSGIQMMKSINSPAEKKAELTIKKKYTEISNKKGLPTIKNTPIGEGYKSKKSMAQTQKLSASKNIPKFEFNPISSKRKK